MTKALDEYQSPTRKVLKVLKVGRDKLRTKYQAVRTKLRRAENQVRAVEKSRDTWKERAQAAEAQLRDQKKTS